MLERSMFKYCSEPSLPSHKLPISALVPEIICNKLFSSLVAFETDSFEIDLRGVRGDLPSGFTLPFAAFAMPFLIEIIRRKCANMTRPNRPWLDEISFAIGRNRFIFLALFMNELRVENLHVAIGDQQIVRGLSLAVPRGEVHAVMGPNGSGKSTLAKVMAGHPDYQVTKGKITMDGEDLLALKTVAHGVNTLRGSNIGILLITHYQRILNYIVPDHVHVMVQGRIVRSGGKDLALELEERGYDWARAGADEPVLIR